LLPPPFQELDALGLPRWLRGTRLLPALIAGRLPRGKNPLLAGKDLGSKRIKQIGFHQRLERAFALPSAQERIRVRDKLVDAEVYFLWCQLRLGTPSLDAVLKFLPDGKREIAALPGLRLRGHRR
jgi:hypothetical protein